MKRWGLKIVALESETTTLPRKWNLILLPDIDTTGK